MNAIPKRVFALVFWVALHPAVAWGQDIYITEFAAVGSVQALDNDGDDEDFIEIYNDGVSNEDLGGYFLSDDCEMPLKWAFPANVILPPGRFLVVWASEKDRTDPCCPMHTNFRLDGDGNGECVILSDSFGDEIHSYGAYPNQQLGYTYGLPMDGDGESEFISLVEPGAPCTAYIPPSSPSSTDLSWTEIGFNDTSWLVGTTGVGYDTAPDFDPLIGLNVIAMHNNNTSCYVRIPFQIADPATVALLDFEIQFDDGYIAYINGTRVTSRNATAAPTSTSSSPTASLEADAHIFLEAAFNEGTPTLVEGENILAIHALNRSTDSSDLLARPRLEGTRLSIDEGTGLLGTDPHYLDVPTPGRPNVPGAPGVSEGVDFSEPSGAYPPGLSIDLSLEVPMAGAEIRYTLDQTDPDENSSLYTGPIDVEGELVIAARAFRPGVLPSKPTFKYYIILGSDVLSFSSTIPIFVCSTLGQNIPRVCSTGPYTEGRFLLFKTGADGRAHLLNDVDLEHFVGYRRRGNPSVGCLREKMYFNIEFRDREGKDDDEQLFDDFANHSDYAMFPPWNIDLVFMRNPLSYWMSREIGQWAPRTEFVECFLHTPGQQELTMASYHGVYVFSERIKRGEGRLDLNRLDRGDNEKPDVTGGYILQRDRTKAGDTSITAGGFPNIVFSYPRDPTPEQLNYIRDYINTAINSLHSGVADPEDSDLIDVVSFRDYHILNFYPKEVDAFIFSAYMYKPRNGPLFMGPAWDFDRSMGAAFDTRVADPLGWESGSTAHFASSYSWYGRLFGDQVPTNSTPWAKSYRARWRELRQGPWSTPNINAQIDEWAAVLEEPAQRNLERWPQNPPRFGGYQGEVDHLKDWLLTRANWIDAQFQDIDGEFVEAPVFSHQGGAVEFPLQVEISAPAGDIYYTLNGRDPRAGFEPVPEAILYSGPITITGQTRIAARVRDGMDWSLRVDAQYLSTDSAIGVFQARSLQVNGGPLPPQAENFTVHNGGNSYTSVATTGRDLWEGGDTFEFAYSFSGGDFDVSIRVDDVINTATNPDGSDTGILHNLGKWGKWGLMARRGPDPVTHEETDMLVSSHHGGAGTHGSAAPFCGDPCGNGSWGRNSGVEGERVGFPHGEYLRLTRRGNVLQSWTASHVPDSAAADALEASPHNDAHWTDMTWAGAPSVAGSPWWVGFSNQDHAVEGTQRNHVDFTILRWLDGEIVEPDPIEDLVVTEIMYDPPAFLDDEFGASLYEFIEFQNVGDEPLDLTGVTLDAPLFNFTDGAIRTLGVGDYVVVARSTSALVERYGSGIPIAGEFSGGLSNTSQTILVTGPLDEVIMDFDYQSSWQPLTNGQGHSLVIRNATATPSTWDSSASWRGSIHEGGSPGEEDVFVERRLQGDLDGDGFWGISDVMGILFILTGQISVLPCSTLTSTIALFDVDGDGEPTVNDALHLLRFVFVAGPPPDMGTRCVHIDGCPDACF